MSSRIERDSLIQSTFAAFHLSSENNHDLLLCLMKLREKQLANPKAKKEEKNLEEFFKAAGKKSQVKKKVFQPETHPGVSEIVEELKNEEGDLFVVFMGIGLIFLGERADKVNGWLHQDYRKFLGDRHIAQEYQKHGSLTVYIRQDKKK